MRVYGFDHCVIPLENHFEREDDPYRHTPRYRSHIRPIFQYQPPTSRPHLSPSCPIQEPIESRAYNKVSPLSTRLLFAPRPPISLSLSLSLSLLMTANTFPSRFPPNMAASNHPRHVDWYEHPA